MKFSRTNTMILGLVLILVAAVTFMISWSGGDENIARELDAEPEISVYFHETGEMRTMKLEEYLAGVVAGEMFPDWPLEAYAAQAIFARSFTFAFLAEGGLQDKYGADISTNIQEAQAYNEAAITPEIKQAIEMTRGEVMTYDNRYIKAWFHAYSGGHTTTAKEGLNYQDPEPPYITSVKLPENEFIPADDANWQVQYSLAELQPLLAKAGVSVGEIQDVQISERGATNRVTQVEISGTENTQTIHGANFRIAVDSTKMKSTLVDEWQVADGVLTITGKGYGHGVGLSQWDAYKMARDGMEPEAIATSFFQGVEIKKIYD